MSRAMTSVTGTMGALLSGVRGALSGVASNLSWARSRIRTK
jgi:hypothetical protein